MSKVDEYTGNGMIVVSDGEVWAVDDSGLPDVCLLYTSNISGNCKNSGYPCYKF